MKRPRKPSSTAELVRRGVIDRRRLPHPLTREQAADVSRRIDELRAKARQARADDIPF